jgi:hypothetical protein
MDNLTSGHMSTQQGIRGHSAGDVFPYVIVAVGTPDELSWHITGMGLAIGDCTWSSYYYAHKVALNYKDQDRLRRA